MYLLLMYVDITKQTQLSITGYIILLNLSKIWIILLTEELNMSTSSLFSIHVLESLMTSSRTSIWKYSSYDIHLTLRPAV